MKPAILTAAACLLVAICAPVVQAEDASAQNAPGPVIHADTILKPYCDPKNRDPNDDLQPTYCGAWSAYYVVTHYAENVSAFDPVMKTVQDARAASDMAVQCALEFYSNPDCPWRLADAL
jgi:hypothetical protein